MATTVATSLMRELLSPRVACVELIGDLDADLFPEEEAVLARVTHPRRRREFATGRACARAALERLGVPAGAVPMGPRREPCWPEGVVGSITHCDGDYRGVAVARAREIVALGIDAEPNRPLPPGVLEVVAGVEERTMLAELGAAGVCWDRLLFCAKEAVYKAWYPAMHRWLGFADARVWLEDRGFTVRLDEPLAGVGDTLAGRWNIREGVIGATVEVESGV